MDDLQNKQEQLLEELLEAKKNVERLERVVAENAALLGTGVTYPDTVSKVSQKEVAASGLPRYLSLVEKKKDLSDYIGYEGDESTRPRLGSDAPLEVYPKTEPVISPAIGTVVAAHPDDSTGVALSGLPNPLVTNSILDQKSSDSISEPQTMGRRALETSDTNQNNAVATKISGNALEMMPQSVEDKESATSLALKALDPGIFEWNLAQNTVYSSPRWVQMVGTEPGASNPLQYFVQQFVCLGEQNLQDAFTQLLGGHLELLSLTVRLRRKDKQKTWFALRAVCVLNAANKPEKLVVTVCNVFLAPDVEHALQTNEEKFRVLAEGTHDIIWRFDQQGKILYASLSLAQYILQPVDQVVGLSLVELGFTGDISVFTDKLKQVQQYGVPVQAELHLLTPVKRPVVLKCHFWPELGPDGDVQSITVQARDTTAAKRVAENYKALFTQLVDGFALFSYEQPPNSPKHYAPEDFVFVALNPALSKMLKIDPREVIGKRVNEIFGVHAADWTASCLRPVLEKGSPTFVKLRVVNQLTLFEVSSYSPEQNKVACIIKDVTAIQAIAQEVRLNEARLAALYRLSHMDAAPESQVIGFSLDQAVHLTGSRFGFLLIAQGTGRTVTYWSQGVLSAYTQDSLPALPNQELLRKIENTSESLHKALIVNDIAEETVAHFAPLLPVNRYMLAPVIEDGRLVCVAGVANKEILYEEADLRQLELFINGMWFQLRRRWTVEKLREAKEEAEAASRAKNEFLANVSHELRTPLNGILGMLQLLQQTPLSPVQYEYISTANYSCRSLLRIISDILDFSRIEAGRFELKPQLFDFAATLRSTLGMFIHDAEQKKIKLLLDVSESMPKLLLGDDSRIRQLIFNLVGNAFKFTDQGSIHVYCSRLPSSFTDKAVIYFSVEDTGIGIPDSKLDQIFQAFTQLDGTSTRRYAGTGLGLGIVRRLIKLMGGALCVESEIGVGTAVHCSIPLLLPDSSTLPLPQVGETALPPAEPLEILVAEDDATNRLTISSMLKKGGHTVTCVNDGHQALEALMLHSYDCLITDIQMPVMDGEEVVRRIRQGELADIEPSAAVREILGISQKDEVISSVPVDLPIIALTAHAMSGDKEHFISLGIDYYLSKPILVKELNEILSRVSQVVYSRK